MNEKVSIEPQLQDRSLLAADRATEETRRIETDADGNIYVNVAAGSLTPVGPQDVNIIGSEIDVPVEVTNFPAIQEVEGNVTVDNFPAIQEVEGTVSVDNFPAVQDVTGTVSVDNFPAIQDVEIVATIPLPVTGPLTDGELRATPVPVSGTVTAVGPLTDTELRATPVPVSGTVAVNNFPATQPISAVSLPLPTGAATEAKQTQPGVDIGDVTVNNASGGSAVNIQDGGNIITVDGTVIADPITVASASLTNVSGSASSVQLLASNSARRMALFYNDSSAELLLKFGTTASATSFTVAIPKDSYYELPKPVYTGQIDGIWSSASGAVRITEL